MTENKRLGDVLSFIKAQQDPLPAPKVKTNKTPAEVFRQKVMVRPR